MPKRSRGRKPAPPHIAATDETAWSRVVPEAAAARPDGERQVGAGDRRVLGLLTIASALLSAFSERPSLSRRDEPPLRRDDILQTFFEVPLLETSALLAAVAGLSGDDVLRHRVRREIAGRAHVLPHWLAALDEAEPVDGAFEMKHVLGDGENVVVGVRLPGGHELCAAVYIDHDLGTLVKDAYVVPGSLSELTELMRTTADDPTRR